MGSFPPSSPEKERGGERGRREKSYETAATSILFLKGVPMSEETLLGLRIATSRKAIIERLTYIHAFPVIG